MPSLLTQHYRSQLGNAFRAKLAACEMIDTLSANGSLSAAARADIHSVSPMTTLYLTVGRTHEWDDDNDPPTPVEDIAETTYRTWHDMIAAKRCYSANINFVVPRVDWTSGSVYAQYDDTDPLLQDKEFYVLDISTGTGYAYKCLWNNSNAASTNSPGAAIGTDPDPTMLPDGYTWQYLYTVQLNDKFLTANWMPVYEDAAVVSAAEDLVGSLPESVPLVITEPGSSYNGAVNIVTTISGDGSGATVSSSGGTVVSGGRVTSIMLATGGNNYSRVESVNVYQLGASAASARVIIPPYPNHGADPVTELYAKHLMVYLALANSESGKITVANDIRQVGLLISPVDATTGEVANGDVYRQTYDLTLSANTKAFTPDTIIFNYSISANSERNLWGVPTAKVVDAVLDGNSNVVVRLTDVNKAGQSVPFANSDVIRCESTDTNGTVSTYDPPELTAFTGDVLYVNQRTPIIRDDMQFEEFKVILPFGG